MGCLTIASLWFVSYMSIKYHFKAGQYLTSIALCPWVNSSIFLVPEDFVSRNHFLELGCELFPRLQPQIFHGSGAHSKKLRFFGWLGANISIQSTSNHTGTKSLSRCTVGRSRSLERGVWREFGSKHIRLWKLPQGSPCRSTRELRCHLPQTILNNPRSINSVSYRHTPTVRETNAGEHSHGRGNKGTEPKRKKTTAD